MARKFFQNKELEPDEIFLDSKNLPGFEQERFEGRLEFPISVRTFWYLGLVLAMVFGLFFYRLFDLQVSRAPVLKARAEANHLKILPLWPKRGRILDRRGVVLADNDSAFRLVRDNGEVLEDFSDWQTLEESRKKYQEPLLRVEAYSSRRYPEGESFAHVLGYLGYLSPEEVGQVASFEVSKLVGRSGLEEVYEKYLTGRVGSKLTEVNSEGEIFSEAVERLPEAGDDIYLSVDARLQKRVLEEVKDLVESRGFKGGAAVLLDVQTGEILSLVSYPSFNPNILTRGGPEKEVEELLTSPKKPLFNRAVSGLYSSGSVIKPLLALAALEERVIVPEKEILSTGSLTLPNPFQPDQPSVFYDWKAHGWVDMRHAIAVSSNVYFFTIGGGFGDVSGLGVRKIQNWLEKFGFGQITGIDLGSEKAGFIPSPEWKAQTQKDDPIWRIGDTYNLSIGQGNFQVTPLQMAVFVASLANGGKILEPHILKQVKSEAKLVDEVKPLIKKTIGFEEKNLKVVQEGMRLAAEVGTAQALSGLKVKVAAKTGTAEIGSGKSVNSWFIGFFPYETPRLSLAVVLEGGNASNLVGATAASRQIIEWISIYRPELLETLQSY